jgi:muramidase (phage lysozyme)
VSTTRDHKRSVPWKLISALVTKEKALYNKESMTQLLEQAISKVKELSSAEQDAMAAVILAELEHADWDRQIEQDLKAGRFDNLIKKVREGIAAGKCQPL